MTWIKLVPVKMKVLAVLLLSASSSAYANCSAGQMTKLVAQAEVSRKIQGTAKKEKFTLQPGTEVHVIAVKKDKIDIYAMNDLSGTYINGLGEISPKSLACQ